MKKRKDPLGLESQIDQLMDMKTKHNYDDLVTIARVFAEYVEAHRYQLPEANENEGKRLYEWANKAKAIAKATGGK